MEEGSKKQGRPRKDPARHKRNRTLSLTDDEYAYLGDLAAAANRGVSEYVIERLRLDTKPTLLWGGYTGFTDKNNTPIKYGDRLRVAINDLIVDHLNTNVHWVADQHRATPELTPYNGGGSVALTREIAACLILDSPTPTQPQSY